MTRRISAHYVFPVLSPPVKNGIVEFDGDGTLLRLTDPGGPLREMSRLEFYDGILFPGLLLAFPPYLLEELNIVPVTNASPAGSDRWMYQSGLTGWSKTLEKKLIKGSPGAIWQLILEKIPRDGVKSYVNKGFWIHSSPEKEALEILSSLPVQNEMDFLVIDTTGWKSVNGDQKHVSRLKTALRKYFTGRKIPLISLLSEAVPTGNHLPDGSSVPITWMGTFLDIGNNTGETKPGFLHVLPPAQTDTSWLLRALYHIQSMIPGTGISETLPLLTSGTANYFYGRGHTGTLVPGEKTGLNLATGVDLVNLKWKADSRLKKMM